MVCCVFRSGRAVPLPQPAEGPPPVVPPPPPPPPRRRSPPVPTPLVPDATGRATGGPATGMAARPPGLALRRCCAAAAPVPPRCRRCPSRCRRSPTLPPVPSRSAGARGRRRCPPSCHRSPSRPARPRRRAAGPRRAATGPRPLPPVPVRSAGPVALPPVPAALPPVPARCRRSRWIRRRPIPAEQPLHRAAATAPRTRTTRLEELFIVAGICGQPARLSRKSPLRARRAT